MKETSENPHTQTHGLVSHCTTRICCVKFYLIELLLFTCSPCKPVKLDHKRFGLLLGGTVVVEFLFSLQWIDSYARYDWITHTIGIRHTAHLVLTSTLHSLSPSFSYSVEISYFSNSVFFLASFEFYFPRTFRGENCLILFSKFLHMFAEHSSNNEISTANTLIN